MACAVEEQGATEMFEVDDRGGTEGVAGAGFFAHGASEDGGLEESVGSAFS